MSLGKNPQEITTIIGKVIDPFEGVREGFIRFCNGIISEKDDGPGHETVLDFSECYISPGFIDIHVHGGAGADFVEGTREAVEKITRFHSGGGTTSLLATVIPIEKQNWLERLQRLARVIEKKGCFSVNLLGIHLEGPFINKSKKGALNEKFIAVPDIAFLSELTRACSGQLKMMTLAPELIGAEALVKEASKGGIITSAGHTESTGQELEQARGWGLRNTTHFYNAMAGFHHRRPGTVGGVFVADGLNIDIIPEENHVHPDAFRLAWKQKGPGAISIITDCTSPGGLSDGNFKLGGKKVRLDNGVARLIDGTLAGSTITMIQGIKYLIEKVGLSVEDAVGLATINPARLLGLEDRKGRFFPGADADIAVFNSKFEILLTVTGGRIVYAT